MNQPPNMGALLSLIASTTSFGSSLFAGVAAAAEPFNWSLQVGGTTLHSISDIPEHQCLQCGKEESVAPDNDK